MFQALSGGCTSCCITLGVGPYRQVVKRRQERRGWPKSERLMHQTPVSRTDAAHSVPTLSPPPNRFAPHAACIPRRNIQPSLHARFRLRFHRPRQSRPRSDEHRQDPSRHRAHAGARLRHHRLPPPPARPRELRPHGGAQGRPPRRPDHRRGEDRPARGALVLLHRRGHAARPRRRVPGGGRDPALRRPRPRPRLHRPAAARPRHGRDHVPGRRDDPPAAASPGAAGQRRDAAAAVAAQPTSAPPSWCACRRAPPWSRSAPPRSTPSPS